MTAVVVRSLVGLDLPVMIQIPPLAIESGVATVLDPVPGRPGRVWGMVTSEFVTTWTWPASGLLSSIPSQKSKK